jgi:uncharacterized protein (TIGR02001 family)
MKNTAILLLAAATLSALINTPAVQAAEARIGADIKSAYVFRGTTYNEGFVAQPYLDVSGLPIDIGAWGNFDLESDQKRGYENGQFSELDLYAFYQLPIESIIDVTVGYFEYTYPNSEAEADREITLSLSQENFLLQPNFAIYYGMDGAIEENFYADASIGHDLEVTKDLSLNLGALIGYLDSGEADGEDGFNQYELSATLAYDFVTLGVKYIGQIDDEVLTDEAHDVDVVGTLGVSHSF